MKTQFESTFFPYQFYMGRLIHFSGLLAEIASFFLSSVASKKNNKQTKQNKAKNRERLWHSTGNADLDISFLK